MVRSLGRAGQIDYRNLRCRSSGRMQQFSAQRSRKSWESSGKAPGKVSERPMAVDQQFIFGDVRFDSRTGELRREDRVTKLTPRAAAVLCALAERAQQLVTKQELFDRVWSGRVVSDDALTSCIQELRNALDDDARRPRYIETSHRRGYRLLMPTSLSPIDKGVAGSQIEAAESTLVGRAVELATL